MHRMSRTVTIGGTGDNTMFSVGQAHVRCTVPVVMLAPLSVDVAETRRRNTDRI
jgi:hypothetical protein